MKKNLSNEERKALNDLHNRKVSSESSWLCDLFQRANIDVKDKQAILKEVVRVFLEKERQKEKELING